MIMRKSVILIDQIDRDIETGAAPWDAIVKATVRRARTVVLTAVAVLEQAEPPRRRRRARHDDLRYCEGHA